MFDRATTRMLPVVERTAEHVPMATACCNACRTCVSSNLVGLAMAGVLGAAVMAKRLAQNLIHT